MSIESGTAITPNANEKPAGGWHSLQSVEHILVAEQIPLLGVQALLKQNKPDGFTCVSCAWAKPENPRTAEFCEQGAKATAWELTSKRVPAEFFAQHTATELAGWSDHDLEAIGRLTEPMQWDAATDRYVPVSWDDAVEQIGAALRALRVDDPQTAVFYASGRASIEASYLYQLFARLYGNNNLPDSSNMCHESTSVALPATIGSPVGTVTLADFAKTEAIFFFGQNVGVSSPRMLHPLQEARERGAPIVTFNPLRERGSLSFVNPQSPVQMLTPAKTVISTHYLQVRTGGDIAAIAGVCKAILAIDERAAQNGERRALDTDFIAQHTAGFEPFAAWLRGLEWRSIERESGLTRAALEEVATVYANANAVIGVYGMGLTQHRRGVLNVQMVSNLLLLGGNIGKPGAGICPVRGHSNVQGQRTVGITEKPELAPLDTLASQYGFEPPRSKGRNTVETCRGVLDGTVKAFIGLGGNFLRAAPDTGRVEAWWQSLELTVHVATKLNHTHLVPGKVCFLLPCLGRIEHDEQAGGAQTVCTEDSAGFMHGSKGFAKPAAATLRSEIDIIAALAERALPPNPKVPWRAWVCDYAQIRESIETTYPDVFADFNERFTRPGGFQRPIPARQREWKTPNGKANFIVPDALAADPEVSDPDVVTLMTLRSDNQFNTTVYSLNDTFRGVEGTRQIVFVGPSDMERLGLNADAEVTLTTAVDDGFVRRVGGLRVVPYDLPPGCIAAYFPECNPLVPLEHHALGSQVPAYKSIPVRIALKEPS